MKKLFIIALSIFTLVAFTTPAVAGGTSGNGTAFNGHVEGLAMIGSVAPGHTAGIAVDGALAAGYAGGHANYGTSVWADQNTKYKYGYGYEDSWGQPNKAHKAGGLVQAWGKGSMSQYSGGNNGSGHSGDFRAAAMVGQGSITAGYGTPNTGFSGMVQATGGVAYANEEVYRRYGHAYAGFNSKQTDSYFMYNQTNANNYTMHSGVAKQQISGYASDYGYDYQPAGETARAGIIQGGVTLTHHNSTGNSMYMGGAQVTGAHAGISLNGYGNGHDEASAHGTQTYKYAQGQQTNHGFQWQTGSSHTNVNVTGGY